MKDPKVNFVPVPEGIRLHFQLPGNEFVSISELLNLIMHLSIDNPNTKVRFWVEVENEVS